MKNKGFKIASIIVASVLCILILVGTIVPAIKYEYETVEENMYFFSLFASTNSSSSVTSFGAVFTIIIFIAAPLCVIFDNKVVKALGLVVEGAMLSYAIYVLKIVEQMEDSFNKTYIDVSNPGTTLILVAAIIGILYAAIDLVVLAFGDKLKSVVVRSSKSTKELLEENEELYKSGYISIDERDARKSKILGVK